MNQAQTISFTNYELGEIARIPRLELTVDFTKYTWVHEAELPAIRSVLEQRGKASFASALLAFMDERGVDIRSAGYSRLLSHFPHTANVIALAVHFDHDERAIHVHLLDQEAMLGRLNSAEHWHTPGLGQLLALVQRFGARCLPGLLHYASNPTKDVATAATVLSKFGPEVAPVMARALVSTRLRTVVTDWLDAHRAAVEPAMLELMRGAVAAVAYLDRTSPIALDATSAAIVRTPEVAELLMDALGERPSVSKRSGVYLGAYIDRECASTDARFVYGEPRTVRSDAEVSATELADMERLFENLGDGFPKGGTLQAFLKTNWALPEGITLRTIEDVASSQRYVAYLHAIGDNTAGFVVRDDAERAVVAEISESGLTYEPADDAPWPSRQRVAARRGPALQ
jgi:hypothetical protein